MVINILISIRKSVKMKHAQIACVYLPCYKLTIESSNERYMAQRRVDIRKFERRRNYWRWNGSEQGGGGAPPIFLPHSFHAVPG